MLMCCLDDTKQTTLSDMAHDHRVSRWTLHRHFEPFWLIDIPNTPDLHRVYDQIFIDGAYSAIKTRWPTTVIQRCTVHAARVVRRYTTSRPRTDAGNAIYRLAVNLTRIRTQQ